VIAWYLAVMESQKVDSGAAAFQKLINSSRIATDLSRALTEVNPTAEFDMYIIVREWVFIHPSMVRNLT
jgi:hypothetical protein